MATVKHVVLDSGAFLRNAPVQSIGERVYTVVDVVDEIKDKATKQRLQVLPYELEYREPSAEAVKMVSEFAKKTGDYRSLSAVDIRVMAITYQLEKEHMGTDHLKTEPDLKVQWTASKQPLEKATDIAGFYVKSTKSSSRTVSECSSINPEQHLTRSDEVLDRTPLSDSAENDKKIDNEDMCTENTINNEDSSESQHTERNCKKSLTENKENNISKDADKNIDGEVVMKIEDSQEGEVINDDQIGEESESDDDSGVDDDDDDDDDDGWITPSNIKSVKAQMGGSDLEMVRVEVGCLTTDFAMQNVLIQMGLNVISVDGMLIKRAKSFVLRCQTCMKITTNLEKQFCPHCGNKALSRVSMTVNEDGSIKYFLSRRRQVNTRGLKFKLPTPQGGKHSANPRLAEDQPFAQNRVSKKARAKNDVFDPDYIANTSPFTINDVTSRAAMLGIRSQKGQTHYWDKRNPNAVKKHTGKRK